MMSCAMPSPRPPRGAAPGVRSTNGITATEARRVRPAGGAPAGAGSGRRRASAGRRLGAPCALGGAPGVPDRRPVQPFGLERRAAASRCSSPSRSAAARGQRVQQRLVRAAVEGRERAATLQRAERFVAFGGSAAPSARAPPPARRASAGAAPTSQPLNAGCAAISSPSRSRRPNSAASARRRSRASAATPCCRPARPRSASTPQSARSSATLSPSVTSARAAALVQHACAACSGTSAARRADRSARPTAARTGGCA